MTDEQLADLTLRIENLDQSMGRLFGIVSRAMAEVVNVSAMQHEVHNLRSRVALLEADRVSPVEGEGSTQ